MPSSCQHGEDHRGSYTNDAHDEREGPEKVFLS